MDPHLQDLSQAINKGIIEGAWRVFKSMWWLILLALILGWINKRGR